MLDYRVLTFMKVCETLNFTQAAKELHITQPAVTKHTQNLESDYQTKLFTFSGEQCQLTKSGRELLDLLTTINNDIQHFKSHLNQGQTPINFGVILTIGEYVLSDSLAVILFEYSNFQVKMLVDNIGTLLRDIDQGKVDFALIKGFSLEEKYDLMPYKTEPFIAIASPKAGLTDKTYTLGELLDYPITTREQGSGTREMLEVTLKEANLAITDLHHITEIGSLNAIRQLITDNLGITFVYKSMVRKELDSGKLFEVKLDLPPISHGLTFVWRKGSHSKSLYQDILKLSLTD